MRLRNKETGEIGEIAKTYQGDEEIEIITDTRVYIYTSLLKISMEWEDYEEPKGTYFINTQGDVQFWDSSCSEYPDDWTKEKEIGNYFESKEEAEKAVEKLKAWKRLKDKGFRFILDGETEMPMFVYSGANGEKCITSAEESKQCRDDIKLLFGGEE